MQNSGVGLTLSQIGFGIVQEPDPKIRRLVDQLIEIDPESARKNLVRLLEGCNLVLTPSSQDVSKLDAGKFFFGQQGLGFSSYQELLSWRAGLVREFGHLIPDGSFPEFPVGSNTQYIYGTNPKPDVLQVEYLMANDLGCQRKVLKAIKSSKPKNLEEAIVGSQEFFGRFLAGELISFLQQRLKPKDFEKLYSDVKNLYEARDRKLVVDHIKRLEEDGPVVEVINPSGLLSPAMFCDKLRFGYGVDDRDTLDGIREIAMLEPELAIGIILYSIDDYLEKSRSFVPLSRQGSSFFSTDFGIQTRDYISFLLSEYQDLIVPNVDDPLRFCLDLYFGYHFQDNGSALGTIIHVGKKEAEVVQQELRESYKRGTPSFCEFVESNLSSLFYIDGQLF